MFKEAVEADVTNFVVWLNFLKLSFSCDLGVCTGFLSLNVVGGLRPWDIGFFITLLGVYSIFTWYNLGITGYLTGT